MIHQDQWNEIKAFVWNLWCCMAHRRSWTFCREGDWSHVTCPKCPADRNQWAQPR